MSIENYEAMFLTHLSFVDTTSVELIPADLIEAAYEDEGRRHGLIAPFLQQRIKEMVESHEALTADEKALVLTDP
ncbi:hypothetical protein GCM10008012_23220 [Rhizobium anhuiense]|nr:hypothetical protein GCM10008012_23220 [Rhizobium anhuiense]